VHKTKYFGMIIQTSSSSTLTAC